MIADLTGRVALVTGGAAGIGRAVVELLVEQGATAVATDIAGDALDALADTSRSGRLHTARLDVTDRDAVQRVVDETATAHGRLDILVCSAGIVLADEEERTTNPAADWERCMAVNLYGTVHACEAAAPHLRRSGDGAIVTIGSISAHAARAASGPYPVSKAAVLRYTKGLAGVLAPDVHVNAVCPGAVWTGMQARIAAEIQRHRGNAVVEDESTFFARYESITPMRRPQTPRDVAAAVVFLASPDARNITGQCLHVDGGTIIRD